MTEIERLLNLPVETLAVLAAGYMAYRIAYTGRDDAHSGVDTLFISLIFALIAKITIRSFTLLGSSIGITMLGILSGIVASALAAVFWKRWGIDAVHWLLNQLGIPFTDRSRQAWDVIRRTHKYRPSQLIVRRKDGTMVMCDRLDRFQMHRPGPCVFGPDGSVALYVTHDCAPEGDWEECEHSDPEMGSLMTVIPAEEIATTHVRFKS